MKTFNTKHCAPLSVSRRALFIGVLANIAGLGAAVGASAQQSQPPADIHAASITIPGVPTDRPGLVTVVPFYEKPNETENERTKVIIPAWVDSAFGLFVVDMGAPPLVLNRTFLQPSPTGGVDSVTAANRIPEKDNEPRAMAHVTMRIGTLTAIPLPLDRTAGPAAPNAILSHAWGNFSWVFAPRLGNIGLSVLESFETIIDYTHKRLILIRLDSAGHRLADVPAYTPTWTTPLVDVDKYWGIKVMQEKQNTADTTSTASGSDSASVESKLASLTFTLDTANAANNTQTVLLDTGQPHIGAQPFLGLLFLGYSFLRPFGVVGFNHRTHQFILYH